MASKRDRRAARNRPTCSKIESEHTMVALEGNESEPVVDSEPFSIAFRLGAQELAGLIAHAGNACGDRRGVVPCEIDPHEVALVGHREKIAIVQHVET